MRGKGFIENEAMIWGRITPAYAGKSAGDRLTIHIKWDHPRLCGEKKHYILPFSVAIGSPPPMRGKAFGKICNNLFNRITPAYAGKRLIMYIMCGQIRDHPRLCGEKCVWEPMQTSLLGSPPPMRGKESLLHIFFGVYQDHPRLCGEKYSQNPK